MQTLKAIVSRLNHVIVDVIPFRNEPDEMMSFVCENGSSDALGNFLESLPYDGGECKRID